MPAVIPENVVRVDVSGADAPGEPVSAVLPTTTP